VASRSASGEVSSTFAPYEEKMSRFGKAHKEEGEVKK